MDNSGFGPKLQRRTHSGLECKQLLKASIPELSDWAAERRRTAGLEAH